MSLNVFSTACQDDCTAVIIPAISTDQDCIGFEDFRSQICGLLFVHPGGNDPADWTDRDSWTAIIDNALADVNAAKYLTGIGNMPVPEKTQRTVAKLKTKVVRRTFTITLGVLNMSDQNRTFLETLQCGDTNYKVWIETVDGHLFGGETGITVSSMDVDMPLEEGQESYEEGTVIITFDATGDPPRTRIINLSENFTTGNVEPVAPLVIGTSANDVWGTGVNDVWGVNL